MKNIFKWIGYVLSWPFVGLALLLGASGCKRKAKKYRKNPEEVFLQDRQRKVYKLFKKAYYLKRIEVHAEGFENLPSKQMFFICNHKSIWDPLALYTALYEANKLGPTSFVAKAELFDNRLLRHVMELIDAIPIQRDNGRSVLDCFNKQNENAKKGWSIAIYPEGTRVTGDKFEEFKPAAAKVAYENYLTIEPVCIYGSDVENHKRKGTKHHIYIAALKPIQPNNYVVIKQQQFMPSIQTMIEDKYIELKVKAK